MATHLQLETLALGLLCAGTSEGAARDALVPLLQGYTWKSTLHRAIFDAVSAFPSNDAETLRQLLPAKLTRMGFPDVDWEEIFSPLSLSSDEAIAMVRQMIAGA